MSEVGGKKSQSTLSNAFSASLDKSKVGDLGSLGEWSMLRTLVVLSHFPLLYKAHLVHVCEEE